MTTRLIELHNIHKSYKMGPTRLEVLKGVDLHVNEGEFVAMMGPSGSGKSTLLHIAGALDTADEGSVTFRDTKLSSVSRWSRHRIRNEEFGFVFQFYHLLPELSVMENVLLPVMIDLPVYRVLFSLKKHKAIALDLLKQFGLVDRLKHRPGQLSGGERQRVAIARALINQPALLLADEPTGNLDAKTGKTIMDVLLNLHRTGQTILLVTHDPAVAALADRVVRIEDGRVVN